MPLTLKNKSALEGLKGKMWMYKTITHVITDFTEAGDTIIISTNIKAISIKADAIEQFLKDLLPVDSAPAQPEIAAIAPGVDNYFTELAGGLMASFREIQGANDPTFLREAKSRAAAKVQVSKAVTDIAKTIIAGRKSMGNNQ